MPKNTKPIKLKSADYLYFSRCGRYLAASKVQGRIALYDARDGSLLWQDKPLKNIDMLAFSPCGQWLSVTAEGGHWCVLAVEDAVQVAAGRHPRQTHGVFNVLHFLPDGSGLFNIERYTYLDKQTAPPRWEDSREVTAWSFSRWRVARRAATGFAVFKLSGISKSDERPLRDAAHAACTFGKRQQHHFLRSAYLAG